MMKDMTAAVQRIKTLALKDLSNKDIFQLFASAAEELGELSRELLIEEKVFGNTYKPGDEGSRTEAVDLAICALAIFYGRNGSDEELTTILHHKLDKWESKYNQKEK